MKKVVLLKSHTHAGEQLNPGDTFTVSTPSAERLINLGVAKDFFEPVIQDLVGKEDKIVTTKKTGKRKK